MVTLTFLSFLWVFQPPQIDAVSPVSQAKEQVSYYIRQYSVDQQPDLHLWALASLCQNEHAELKNYINQQIADNPQFQSFDKPFCRNNSFSEQLANLAFAIQSETLLLAAVLKEEAPDNQQKLLKRFDREVGFSSGPVNTKEIISRVIDGRAIDNTLLPTDRFYFAHFLLFYEKEFSENGGLPDEYKHRITDRWFSQSTNLEHHTLTNSVYQATLMRALYLIDDYAKINRLYSGLTSDFLLPISQVRINFFRYLSFSMYNLGFYDRCLDILRKFSLPLAKFFDDKETELDLLMYQAIYLYRIGKIQDSQEIYHEVLRQSEEQNITISRSLLYSNMGINHLKSGNFDKYLELQYKALELAQEQNNYSHQIDILRNLYINEKNSKNQESALLYLQQAEKLAQNQNQIHDLGKIYVSFGSYFKDLKSDYTLAGTYYQKADSILNPEVYHHTYLRLLTEKAELNADLNQYTTAIVNYQEIKKLAQQKGDQKNYLDAFVRESELLLKQGKLDILAKRLDQLQSQDLNLLDFKIIVKAKKVQAKYLVQTGKTDEAHSILKQTIKQIFSWTINSTDLQTGFWNVEQEYLDAIQLYADLLIDIQRPEEAMMVLDQLKTINDAELYQDPMVKSTRLNESELNQYRRLTNQLDNLRKRLLSANKDRTLEIQSQIDRLNAQKRALDRKITRLADEEPITVQEVQRQISGKDVILHITELNNQYYVATVTRRDVRFRKIDLDSEMRGLFERTLEELSKGETALDKLYRIGQILHITELPATAENIILIPDSYLYQLPIDIIPVSRPLNNYSYGEATYLIEEYRTEYLTSLNELRPSEDSDTEFRWDYAGFGISDFGRDNEHRLLSLPHARNEVTKIAGELDNLNTHQTILDEKSTEEMFREIAPKSRILHLATHSKVSEQDPLFSTIYMSSSGNNTSELDKIDSQIYAYELFEMNLANDLIMLNSCESGSGSYLQGSGIVGISRALRYAGAKSLILNLWSVNDMLASDFAVQFYRALNDGDSKSEALRKAKLYFLKNKNANPHYWGPYMMLGSNLPVVHPNRMANLFFAAGFMFYLIAVVGISYIVQRRNGRETHK